MLSPLLLAAAAGAFLLFGMGGGRKWPPGQAPLDGWTPELLAGKTTDRVTSPESGRAYDVTSSRPDAQNKTIHAAVRVDKPEWISYVHDRNTGARQLYRVFAPDTGAAQALMSDWGLA